MTALRILLVDDSPPRGRLLSEREPDDIVLLHASTPAEARERVMAREIDAVVLDLALPDAADLHALDVILDAAPEVPVIVLAAPGAAGEALAVQAIQAGAHARVVKGQAPDEMLLALIRSALARPSIDADGAPAAERGVRADGSPERTDDRRSDRGGAIRAFLCDDSPILRILLRQALEQQGFAIVGQAPDGRDLVAMVRDTRTDVLLLDLSMPEVDGLEVLPALRAALPELTIVVVSGHDRGRMAEQAHALGADAYVEKRAPLGEICDLVRTAVEARRSTVSSR
jgi:DNA-binding NarL/FixJ family response regulator